ncbi:MAG: DUF488 domain-containing protein [Solirubrobacterales bacterium]
MSKLGVRIKRVYEPAEAGDGTRILIDRLWPRGLSKEKAAVDRWEKDLAPSAELRKEFDHRPERFDDFRTKYLKELEPAWDVVESIAAEAENGQVTIVYGAREERYNNAVVLLEAIEGIRK